MSSKLTLKHFLYILIGSLMYTVSTLLFIFPHGLLLGGTSGLSVILKSFLPFSPGTILSVINAVLIIASFFILGKEMGLKTLIGSVLTTVFIGLLEQLLIFEQPIIPNRYLSSIVGSGIIALASAMLFSVNSSSGGTDIIALIVKKFSNIQIGRALLITDILIVLVGGLLSNLPTLLSSTIGLLIKTLGIDWIIALYKRITK